MGYAHRMTLERWLTKNSESGNAFSQRTGIPQTTISRIIRGAPTSIKNALTIQKATKGKVSVNDLQGN